MCFCDPSLEAKCCGSDACHNNVYRGAYGRITAAECSWCARASANSPTASSENAAGGTARSAPAAAFRQDDLVGGDSVQAPEDGETSPSKPAFSSAVATIAAAITTDTADEAIVDRLVTARAGGVRPIQCLAAATLPAEPLNMDAAEAHFREHGFLDDGQEAPLLAEVRALRTENERLTARLIENRADYDKQRKLLYRQAVDAAAMLATVAKDAAVAALRPLDWAEPAQERMDDIASGRLVWDATEKRWREP